MSPEVCFAAACKGNLVMLKSAYEHGSSWHDPEDPNRNM
jgi:hypothetical protein